MPVRLRAVFVLPAILGLVLVGAKPAIAMVAPVLSYSNVTTTSVDLAWTDAGDEQRYIVVKNGVDIQTLFPQIHTFTATGLTPNTTYTFRVDAKKGGTRLASNPVNVTTLAPPAGSCTEPNVDVPAGSTRQYIQDRVTANPDNTQFCFASGTYHLDGYIEPGLGDDFICDVSRTCTLTGDDTYIGAIKRGGGITGTTTNVVRGFIVEHFENSFADAANRCHISAGWHSEIVDNEVRFNTASGICFGTDSVVRGNYVHDGQIIGIHSSGGSNNGLITTSLVENNTVSFNGTMAEVGNNAGGIVVKSSTGSEQRNVTIRGNDSFNNTGTGIWFDGNLSPNFVVDDNDVSGNYWAGIDIELSSGPGVVSNNRLTENATGVALNLSCYNAEIILYESSGVEVFGNTVTNASGKNGICAGPDFGRGGGFNHYVHDNTVKVRRVAGQTTGPFAGGAPYALPEDNIRFENNHYFVDDLSAERWQAFPCGTGQLCTWSEWQAAGHDDTGSVQLW